MVLCSGKKNLRKGAVREKHRCLCCLSLQATAACDEDQLQRKWLNIYLWMRNSLYVFYFALLPHRILFHFFNFSLSQPTRFLTFALLLSASPHCRREKNQSPSMLVLSHQPRLGHNISTFTYPQRHTQKHFCVSLALY